MLRAIAYLFSAPDTRPSEVDPTNLLKEVRQEPHITPVEVETGGSRTSQVVMGDQDYVMMKTTNRLHNLSQRNY